MSLAITYKRIARGYEVYRSGEFIGYVRRSQDGPGWAYALDPQDHWTRVPHSTRHQVTDHLLSAWSPMASWLV